MPTVAGEGAFSLPCSYLAVSASHAALWSGRDSVTGHPPACPGSWMLTENAGLRDLTTSHPRDPNPLLRGPNPSASIEKKIIADFLNPISVDLTPSHPRDPNPFPRGPNPSAKTFKNMSTHFL